MINDESPADVAAHAAVPPEDDAPRGDVSAEPGTASDKPARPTRRRASSTPKPAANPSGTVDTAEAADAAAAAPRATRGRKAAAKPAADAGATPVPVEVLSPAPDAPPAEEKSTRRRTPRRAKAESAEPAAAVEAAAVQTPDAVPPAAEISDIGTLTGDAATEKPARRQRAPRKPKQAASVEVAADSVVSAPQAETEVSADPASDATIEAPAKRTRSTRGRGRAKAAQEATAETAESTEITGADASPAAEAPSDSAATDEAGAPATERTPRRRGGRGRGRGRARAEAAETTVEEPVSAPLEEAAVSEPTDEPASRRRRAVRKKPEEIEDLTKGARLITKRGLPELHVNGNVIPPVFFFGNVEGPKEARRVVSEAQRAAQSGVHLYSTLVELTCPLPPDDSVYETFDNRIQTLLEADSQGMIMPRLVFVPAPGWRKQYPNEVNHYADGSTDDPSIASNHFWSEAEHALTSLVEHVSRMTYAERIIGYHLERGEWFHPSDGGYDRSYANREAFRQWLRNKYKNNEPALRAAWYDGQVQFYTVEIPPVPTKPRQELTFFEPRRERRWIDFLEFTSEITADRLTSLAKAIKTASANKALVSVCYGYTFEFGHTFSGHLALGRLLASGSVDIVAGPPSYRDRQAGGAGSFPGPVQSMPLHGKLWLSEDDTKTYLAPGNDSPDDFNPRIENRFLTEQVHQRAIGKALGSQSGVAWMDSWGEGWLDAPELWERIASFTNRYNEFLKVRKSGSPEVVVLVDERSLLHVQRGEPFMRRILQEQRDMIQRSGASVGFYLQSDLTSRNFPTDAKLYLFLTPYRLPADQRAAVREKLQSGKKTLVWLYAAGVCGERGEPEEFAHDLVGITLRQQSWNSEVGTRVSEGRHPITEGLFNKNIGVRERINPSFYVDDDNRSVTILGEYQGSGLPSLAVREMDGWRSVFCGEPTLTTELFRGLCRYAGVHLFTQGGDDYVFSGYGWVTVHAIRDGQRTLAIPAGSSLYDLNEGQFLGEAHREHRFFAKAKSTYSFFVGTADEMRKMGLPGVEKPVRGRRRAAAPAAPLPETPAEPPETTEVATDLGPDPMAALAEVVPQPSRLRVDLLPLDTDEAGGNGDDAGEGTEEAEGPEGAEGSEGEGSEAPVEGETAEAAERRRRRRRRGGRGRGRRVARPEGGPPAGGAPPAGD